MLSPEHYYRLSVSARFLYSIKIVEIVEDGYGKQSKDVGYVQNRGKASDELKALKIGDKDRKFVLVPV